MSLKKIPSVLKLNELINEFKKKDPNKTSVEEFVKDFASMINYFGFPTFEVPATIKIHRVRINQTEKDFISLKELWCPPIELIKKAGRCNDKGDQILYMSGGSDTALRELNPPIGAIVTCLECEVIEKIQAIDIGVLKNNQREKYLQQYAVMHEIGIKNFYKNNKKLIDLDTKLKEYLVEEFTKSVDVGNEHLYKKTISITKNFLLFPTIEAIMYPSIKSNLLNINYAIPMHFAEKKLKPTRIDVIRIAEHEDKKTIRFELIKGCYEGINFTDPIEYTMPKPIQGWANPDTTN